jgi:phage tail-like protein
MAEPQELTRTAGAGEAPPVRVGCAADEYRRYPGDPVRLMVRVDLTRPAARLRVPVDVPLDIEVTGFESPESLGSPAPVTEVSNSRLITWEVEDGLAVGGSHEFVILGRISHRRQSVDEHETELQILAEAIVTDAEGQRTFARETITVLIPSRARYLKYLPSIYRDDAIIGQLLMMAESLWGPIERQITDIHHYFDPMVMPLGLLRWYAHWVDLTLDPRWPEAKQRRLLSSIVSLYRRRGTPGGLAEFLELYTGVKPKIDEKRARNFSLGKNALLGPSIALGQDNVPHSFAVTLRLPRVPDAEATLRRAVIESIIEAEKPAHTSYTLEIFEY